MNHQNEDQRNENEGKISNVHEEAGKKIKRREEGGNKEEDLKRGRRKKVPFGVCLGSLRK